MRTTETSIELIESFQLQGVDCETIVQLLDDLGVDIVVSATNEQVNISSDDLRNMTVVESNVSSLDSLDLGHLLKLISVHAKIKL